MPTAGALKIWCDYFRTPRIETDPLPESGGAAEKRLGGRRGEGGDRKRGGRCGGAEGRAVLPVRGGRKRLAGRGRLAHAPPVVNSLGEDSARGAAVRLRRR